MPIVSVPHEFFIKERNSFYSNWPVAFFRELFQNSLDAGATKIDITLSNTEKDTETLVRFDDNGAGMTREVLENVYFALGRSTKEGTDSVGGFGRARILTNFSMKSYVIRTGHHRVEGSGASYDIFQDSAYFPGCSQEIIVTGVWYPTLVSALKNYLSRVNFENCEVVLNGGTQQFPYNRGDLLKEIRDKHDRKLADLHLVQKSQVPPDDHGDYLFRNIMVRVKGHPLFEVHTQAEIQATVELEPSLAREIITSNRDGFHGSYATLFSSLFAEFESGLHKLTRPHRESRETEIKGTGSYFASIMPSEDAPAPTSLKQMIRQKRITDPHGEVFHLQQETIRTHVVQNLDISSILPDMRLSVSCQNPKKLVVLPWWDPKNWKVELKGDRVIWKGCKEQVFTMMAWKICLEAGIKILYERLPGRVEYNQLRWQPGFYINDIEVEANCELQYEFATLCIDPLNEDGTPKYDLSDRMSMKKMMAVAKHEVTHLGVAPHNEAFAFLVADIDKYYDEQSVYKEIQAL